MGPAGIRSMRKALGPLVSLMLTVGYGLFAAFGCASSAFLTPHRVARVPDRQYRVVIARNPSNNETYDAVLFEVVPAEFRLNLPGIEPVGISTPGDYAHLLKSGFEAYELPDSTGSVRGYLFAPAGARVTVWDQNARGGGGLLVTVSQSVSVPEAGGGGGSGM
jgi:hypothetical protein